MPRVEKLVPIEGRIGVILDVPPNETGSVILLTQPEIDGLIAAEIEACAKIADDLLQAGRAHRNVGRDEETALLSCAAAIRARGKTEG